MIFINIDLVYIDKLISCYYRYKFEFIKFTYLILYEECDAELELDNFHHILNESYHKYVKILSTENLSLVPTPQMRSSTSGK